MKEVEKIRVGTIRFKTKDLLPYEKTKTSWKKSKLPLTEAKLAISLFKAHNKLSYLISKKNKEFLKGELNPKQEIKGERINILPNGKKLTGMYSLFAKHLTIHDEESHDHWDVIYENPSGLCYLYEEEKHKKHKDKKFSKVKKFEKLFPELEKKVYEGLFDKKDYMSVPIYTLLKTYIRVGNNTYFKHNGHKGLTTLSKDNIKIKGNIVSFKFIAKDGVPMEITHEFPDQYIKRLKEDIKHHKPFVFQSCSGNMLTDAHFKRAFKRYIGVEFFPHIVRSYYATHTTKEYLKHNRKISRKDYQEFLTKVAHDLGHRKFNKKSNEWKESYAVTLHSYIEPKLANKLKERIKN